MQLSDQQISEFQELYRDEYGEELSQEEAREKGAYLVNLFEVLLQTDKHEH